MPGTRRSRPGPRSSGPQGPQRDARARCNCCGPPGSHQVRRGQPHPSQRVAERTGAHRHWQVHPAAYSGQRRTEQSAEQASAPAPGAPPVCLTRVIRTVKFTNIRTRGAPFTLLIAVDDATGTVVDAFFCQQEDAHSYFLLIQSLPAGPTRCPLHRPARRIQTHTRLRPPWHADPVQPSHGGAGRSDDLRSVPSGEGSCGARGGDLPGPSGHRTPAGKRGQHSGEYVRILPEHMLAIIVSGAHWWDTGSLGGSSSDRNPSGLAPAWPMPTAPKFLRTDPLNPAYIPQHHPPTIIAYAPGPGPARAGPGPTAAILQRLRLATAQPSLGHGQTVANPTPN